MKALPKDALNLHKALAMGQKVKGYSHGGVVAQETGKPQTDPTLFQKYGMGYRKVKPK